MVALGFNRADDLANERDVFQRGFAEQLFLAQNLRVGIIGARRRDLHIAFGHRNESEQLRSIHDRQQVIDLKAEIVGESVDVVLAMVVNQKLQQARDAARTSVRKLLIMDCARFRSWARADS